MSNQQPLLGHKVREQPLAQVRDALIALPLVADRTLICSVLRSVTLSSSSETIRTHEPSFFK